MYYIFTISNRKYYLIIVYYYSIIINLVRYYINTYIFMNQYDYIIGFHQVCIDTYR